MSAADRYAATAQPKPLEQLTRAQVAGRLTLLEGAIHTLWLQTQLDGGEPVPCLGRMKMTHSELRRELERRDRMAEQGEPVPTGQTQKAEPVVGSASTKSSQAGNGGAGSASAPLLNATKTVGSEGRAGSAEPPEEEGRMMVALHLCWLAKFFEEQATEFYTGEAAAMLRGCARVARLLADPDNAMCIPGRASGVLRAPERRDVSEPQTP